MTAPYAEVTGDGETPLRPASESPRRLQSLDALRGFDIAAMLLVNHTWSTAVFHRQLFHVPWNDPTQGATITDLVFPWFLFIAGASVPLSMRYGRGRDKPWWRQLLTAFRRGVVLYLLGTILTMAPHAFSRPLTWGDLATWNILQLIGAAYFVAVGIFLMPRWGQIAAVVLILLGKWASMTLIGWETVQPYAGSSMQADSPAGPGTFQHYHGVKQYINAQLGWIGMAQQFLPCAAIAVFGGWTTMLINGSQGNWKKLATVLLFGLALTATAYLLQWQYDPTGTGGLGRFTVPYSKWFFSVPYCLLAAGTGAMLYAIFWLVIDAWRLTDATFLRVWGLNAIFLYAASVMVSICIATRWQVTGPDGEPVNLAGGIIAWTNHATGTAWAGPYLWPTLWLGGWWLVCYWMYRKKLFIRV